MRRGAGDVVLFEDQLRPQVLLLRGAGIVLLDVTVPDHLPQHVGLAILGGLVVHLGVVGGRRLG